MPYALKPAEQPVLPPPPRETPGEWVETLLKERERRTRNALIYICTPIMIGFILSVQGWIALAVGLALGVSFGGMYALMERQTVDPVRLLRDGTEVHASIVLSTGSAPGHAHFFYGEQHNYYYDVDGDPVMRTLSTRECNSVRHVNLPDGKPGIVLLVHPDDPWSPFVVLKQ